MSMKSLIVAICVTGTVFIAAQSQVARCFQFTWLGPRFNNESVFMNATCNDATLLSNGVPCMEPLVASYDGTWPDVDYIWNNYQQEASCVLAANDVCAQYTYSFNGIVENSTYMCTRVVDNTDAALTSGCYEQRNGSWATRVCLCRSVPGGVPCNDATAVPTAILFIVVAGVVLNVLGSRK